MRAIIHHVRTTVDYYASRNAAYAGHCGIDRGARVVPAGAGGEAGGKELEEDMATNSRFLRLVVGRNTSPRALRRGRRSDMSTPWLRRFSAAAGFSKHTIDNYFDFVIVGGGAIGSSIAYHLLSMEEASSVCVVERDPKYEIASSVLSLGSIRTQFSVPVNIQISMKSIKLIRELSQNPDYDVQFDEGGY